MDGTVGLRHLAELGITEESYAIAIVVSEESGNISICHRGKIERGFKPGQFEKRLSELLLRENRSEQHEENTLPEPDTAP
jgi:diadenylate cyclase